PAVLLTCSAFLPLRCANWRSHGRGNWPGTLTWFLQETASPAPLKQSQVTPACLQIFMGSSSLGCSKLRYRRPSRWRAPSPPRAAFTRLKMPQKANLICLLLAFAIRSSRLHVSITNQPCGEEETPSRFLATLFPAQRTCRSDRLHHLILRSFWC